MNNQPRLQDDLSSHDRSRIEELHVFACVTHAIKLAQRNVTTLPRFIEAQIALLKDAELDFDETMHRAYLADLWKKLVPIVHKTKERGVVTPMRRIPLLPATGGSDCESAQEVARGVGAEIIQRHRR